MAHFAHINTDNIVDQVIVAEQDFIDSGRVGDPAKWIQTSYNTYAGKHYKIELPSQARVPDNTPGLRKNYAGVGYTYDPVRDAFIPPKEYESFVLNEETCQWENQVPCPSDGGEYEWDESSLSWVLLAKATK
jgi:hypothetical protein